MTASARLRGGYGPGRSRPTATRPVTGGRVIKGPVRERHEPDWKLLTVVTLLAAIGIVMVYSSSAVRIALDPGGDLIRALVTELVWATLGFAALAFFMFLDYRALRAFARPLFIVAIGLLVLVLLPAIGPIRPIESGGAARWLQLGPLPQMHPAELGKLALIIYLARWLASRGSRIATFREGLLPYLCIAGLAIGLVALEPDLGTTIVYVTITFSMLIVAGARFMHLLLLAPVGLAGLVFYVLKNPYQLKRWTTFLDPWAVALGDGFHTIQGLYALSLGGLFGGGLGQSRAPGGLFLPNADNDFVFAMVGQELGLVGGLLVIGCFFVLGYRGVRIAMGAPDPFGAMLAVGVSAWLCAQAFINIGVVVNLLPVTGITLPFISSGGTSLVVSLAAIGILLSISRETQPRDAFDDADPDRGRRDGGTPVPRARRPAPPRRAAR